MRVPFIAYADDCRVSGHVDLADEARLTDYLNETRDITIFDATLVAHADGRTVTASELELSRDELIAIEATGTRGPEDRRIHTVRHRLEVHLGSYVVLGQLHTMPGGQPLVSIGRRQPMIPFTNATIGYNDAEGLQVHDIDTLILNRERADWVRADEADLAAFPDVPAVALGS